MSVFVNMLWVGMIVVSLVFFGCRVKVVGLEVVRKRFFKVGLVL